MSAGPGATRRLLLVEDNPGDAVYIEALLAEPATTTDVVIVATTLAEASAALRAAPVDAVLLDLRLPDGTGLACVAAIRACTDAAPIVVLTGIDDEAVALACLNAGAQDYLTKNELRGPLLRRALGYAIARAGERAELARRDEELRARNAELVARDAQMRALATRLDAVREAECTRISRVVHDELGQLLTGLKMDLRWIERRLTPDGPLTGALGPRLGEALGLVDRTIETVQRVALELRPSALDALGLAAAVRDEARRFEKRAGAVTRVEVTTDAQPEPATATALFRAFQELLTNVARHAQATTVDITLADDPASWTLRVADDGIGIAPDARRRATALGLLGVQERALALGGTLQMERRDGGGTVATVRVPRSSRAGDDDALRPDRR